MVIIALRATYFFISIYVDLLCFINKRAPYVPTEYRRYYSFLEHRGVSEFFLYYREDLIMSV